MTDAADEEVKGLSRYIPTTLSKAILLLLPSTTWLLFSAIREHSKWFLIQSLTQLEQTLVAALVATVQAWILILILFVDMTITIHHSKHRRITQYSNEHPLMSFKFIMQNATSFHWLFLGFVCTLFFVLGFYAAKVPS